MGPSYSFVTSASEIKHVPVQLFPVSLSKLGFRLTFRASEPAHLSSLLPLPSIYHLCFAHARPVAAGWVEGRP